MQLSTLTFCLLSILLPACSANEPPVKSDIAGLSEYIDLPFAPKTLTYELVIVPEPGGVPGPTDWIGFVAVIEVEQSAVAEIQRLDLSTDSCSLPRYFVRPWFTEPQKDAAYGLHKYIAAGRRSCYEAAPFLTKEAKLSFIAKLDESKFLVYIEYMSPDG